MQPRSPFANPLHARIYVLEKRAEELGLAASLSALPPAAKGALLGGGIGAVSGLFSSTPGSVLRRGLIGAGLGGAAGYGGSKLMDWMAENEGAPGAKGSKPATLSTDPTASWNDIKPGDAKESMPLDVRQGLAAGPPPSLSTDPTASWNDIKPGDAKEALPLDVRQAMAAKPQSASFNGGKPAQEPLPYDLQTLGGW